MQFQRYALMHFEAVERYLDIPLIGPLLLEHLRLSETKKAGQRAGAVWVRPHN